MAQYESSSPPVYYPVPSRPFSGAAIASFVLSLLWLGGVGSLIALVLSIKAMRETRDGTHGGQGLAVAALILSILGVLSSALVVILIVMAGQHQADTYNQIANQIGG